MYMYIYTHTHERSPQAMHRRAQPASNRAILMLVTEIGTEHVTDTKLSWVQSQAMAGGLAGFDTQTEFDRQVFDYQV